MHCHACWPHAFATIHLHCSRWIFMVLQRLYMPHTHTHAYNVQRLWLPRQAARQRSCCNLYAKLFYKLSKKDGVSRKHSRWHTHIHTIAHTHTRAHKPASRFKVGQTSGMSHQPRLQLQLQLQNGFSLSIWACRLSGILIDTHNLFAKYPVAVWMCS